MYISDFEKVLVMEKAREASVFLYIAFIAYEKAFWFSQTCQALHCTLKDMGMSETAVNALKTLYRDPQSNPIQSNPIQCVPTGAGSPVCSASCNKS